MSKWIIILFLGFLFYQRLKANQSLDPQHEATESTAGGSTNSNDDDSINGDTSLHEPIYIAPTQSHSPVFTLDIHSNERRQYRNNKKWFLNNHISGFYLKFYPKGDWKTALTEAVGPDKLTITNDKYNIMHRENRGFVGALTLDGILMLVDEMNLKAVQQDLGIWYSFVRTNTHYALVQWNLPSNFDNKIEEYSNYTKVEIWKKLLFDRANTPNHVLFSEMAGRIKF